MRRYNFEDEYSTILENIDGIPMLRLYSSDGKSVQTVAHGKKFNTESGSRFIEWTPINQLLWGLLGFTASSYICPEECSPNIKLTVCGKWRAGTRI